MPCIAADARAKLATACTPLRHAVSEDACRHLHDLTGRILKESSTSATAVRLWRTAAADKGECASADADATASLHLSLSRTVPARRVQVVSLVAALSRQLRPFRRFPVQLQGLTCLVNDAGTRSFVGARVTAGHEQLLRLLRAVDRAFVAHGLPPFHEVWVPTDPKCRA